MKHFLYGNIITLLKSGKQILLLVENTCRFVHFRLIEFEDYHDDDDGKDALQTNGSMQNLYEGDNSSMNEGM